MRVLFMVFRLRAILIAWAACGTILYMLNLDTNNWKYWVGAVMFALSWAWGFFMDIIEAMVVNTQRKRVNELEEECRLLRLGQGTTGLTAE